MRCATYPNRAHFLIVDDHEAFGRALSNTLRRWGDATLAPTLEAGLLAVRSRPYSAAFFDVRLPTGSGLTLLREFRNLHPEVPAMVLTAYFEQTDSVTACALRAQYVVKPISLAAIEAFVHTASASQREPLSDREREVVERLISGDTTKVIALDLQLSESTVRVLIHRAERKVGALSRPQLLSRARKFPPIP
jgi:DNA-binding NarL/FixJ family response regulator